MTEQIHGSHLGAAYVSEESAYGTTGTERRIHVVADTVDLTLDQAELDVTPLRARPFDYRDPVKGLKTASAKFSHYLQPATTALAPGASVDADSAAPLRVPMRCILGGESVAAGSDVATGTSSAQFDVTGSHGSRFPAGQIILMTDGANGLVPCRVTSRSTDTIQVWPALSGTPSTGDDVVNTYTWYLTRTNTRSMSVALATAQDSNSQWRVNGCTGNIALKLERGALATADFELTGSTWTGPEALSLSTAHAADPMAAPLAVRAATLYLQTPATTTRTNYAIDSCAVKITSGNMLVDSLTGTNEGAKRAVVRAEGLQGPALELEIVAPYTSDFETWWQARTGLSAMLFVTFESTTRRALVIDVPLAVIVGKPKRSKGAGALDRVTFTLKAKLDTSGAQSSELSEAPFRIALG